MRKLLFCLGLILIASMSQATADVTHPYDHLVPEERQFILESAIALESGDILLVGSISSMSADGQQWLPQSRALAVCLNTRDEVVWRLEYSMSEGLSHYNSFKSVHQRYDGSILLDFEYFDNMDQYMHRVIHVDQAGKILSETTVAVEHTSLWFDNDDGYITKTDEHKVENDVSIYHLPILTKYDANGNELWRAELPELSHCGFAPYRMEEGILLVGTSGSDGQKGETTPMIAKLTQSGAFVWKRLLERDTPSSFNDALEMESGNILAVGSTISEDLKGNSYAHPQIVCINADGKVLWDQQLENIYPSGSYEFMHILPYENDFLAIGTARNGSLVFALVDAAGETLKTSI